MNHNFDNTGASISDAQAKGNLETHQWVEKWSS